MFEIRLALPEDFPAIHQLMATNGLTIDGLDYSQFTPPVLLACLEDRPVGFIQALLGRPYALMSEMAVDRKYQDQGIGSELLHAMELLLLGMGYHTWVAFTPHDMVKARLEHKGARPLGDGTAFVRNVSQ